jgi:hypothetical protein
MQLEMIIYCDTTFQYVSETAELEERDGGQDRGRQARTGQDRTGQDKVGQGREGQDKMAVKYLNGP